MHSLALSFSAPSYVSFLLEAEVLCVRSEVLRRSWADNDGPVGGVILLHHDSRRSTATVQQRTLQFQNFRSARESRNGREFQPDTSFITNDLNIIHGARFTLLECPGNPVQSLSYLCYEFSYCLIVIRSQ